MVLTLIIPKYSPLWPVIIPPYWLWPFFGRDTLTAIGGSIAVLYLFAIGLIASVALTLSRNVLNEQDAPRPKTLAGYGWLWLRRIIGSLLMIAGVILLVLPGPGLVTILCGMIFGDFQFFKELERRLLTTGGTLAFINRIRGFFGIEQIAAPRPQPSAKAAVPNGSDGP